MAAVSLWGGDGTARVSVVRSDARTGKLVRSVVVSGRLVPERTVAEAVVAPATLHTPAHPPTETTAAAAPPPIGVPELVARIAAQHSLPPELIHSVIQVESNYNPYAVSSKGARGLMQLIPATARRFGVADVFNPADNIQGGARYLKYLLDLYGGNYPLALAAYNAGEGAVAKYGMVPPYRETENYVKLVGRRVEEAFKAAGAKVAPEVKPPHAAADGVSHIQAVVERDGTIHYISR
ncbi:MAG TPA: lytic transglycosylase domain-containing protein [Candidatus Binataceae bacterium]|nr:lytic transglycosylase domain-containing protein [Candidatus Binataceae bacterium]